MLIVIEGPRCTGKSRLCRILLEELPGPVAVYKEIRGADPTADMVRVINQLTEGTWILDRFHLTEYVMSVALKRRELKNLIQCTLQLDHLLHEERAIGIILHASSTVVAERMARELREPELDSAVSRQLWDEARELSYFKQMPNNGLIDQLNIMLHIQAEMRLR